MASAIRSIVQQRLSGAEGPLVLPQIRRDTLGRLQKRAGVVKAPVKLGGFNTPKFTGGDLRDTCAIGWIEKGISRKGLQQRLAYRDPKGVTRRYMKYFAARRSHAKIELVNAAISRLRAQRATTTTMLSNDTASPTSNAVSP